VPWRDGNIWRGFFPDFLVVREDGERLVVDIIDPNDHTKPDAVGKAKGLSDYAGKHADLLGHIDLVAKIGTRYRRLHFDQLRSATRSMRSRRSANCAGSMSAKGDVVAVYTMEASCRNVVSVSDLRARSLIVQCRQQRHRSFEFD
jgi:hypothetical protein